MEDKPYLKKVQDIWFDKLSEGYATGLSLALVIALSTIFAIRFDWNWLAKLAISVVDVKPLLFFLMCWCVVRAFQLGRATLFRATDEAGALSKRFLRATSDAAAIMIGAYEGVVAGLFVATRESCAHAGTGAALVLCAYAIAAPFVLAFGPLDVADGGKPNLATSWITLLALSAILGWITHDVIKGESQQHKPVCAASDVTVSH